MGAGVALIPITKAKALPLMYLMPSAKISSRAMTALTIMILITAMLEMNLIFSTFGNRMGLFIRLGINISLTISE